jgi:divalent metal cation (Fe/Co/Zn/Cd) transporter
MYFYNKALSVRIDSVALRSTAMDSLSDCVSTAVVLICQVLSLVKGWQLDGWCGLLVSAFILRTGLQTIMETADPLVGKAPDPDLITGISERVLHTKGILDMHDLLVHDYGPGHVMVSLHAEIPSDLSLIKAHEIIDRLESQIDREFGVTSLIHIDPVDVHDHEAINLRSGVLIYLKAMDPDTGLHDFRILRGGDKPVISFDAIFPFSYKKSDEEILVELKSVFKDELPGYRTIIRIDRS